MDQAAEALSNILGGALNEIRDELNELKQSNTVLLKKNDALETAHNQSSLAIVQLQGALTETRSHAEGALAARERDKAVKLQLGEMINDVRRDVAALRTNNKNLNVALAEARNELAAVKMLLDAMGREHSSTSRSVHSDAAAKRKDSAVDTGEAGLDIMDQDDVDEDHDNADLDADEEHHGIEDPDHVEDQDHVDEDDNIEDQDDVEEEGSIQYLNNSSQQMGQLAATSANRPPFTREISVESSMTFCNAEQSAARRKRHTLALFDRAIRWPSELKPPKLRTDESAHQGESPEERRNTVMSTTGPAHKTMSSDHTFVVPALPHRPSTSDREDSPTFPSIRQSLGLAPVREHQATCPDDVDMQDNIVVAPRRRPAAFASFESTSKRMGAASSTMSLGEIADEVLHDFEVDSVAQTTQPRRSLELPNDHTTHTLTVEEPRSDDGSTSEDRDTVDLDSGLKHQPNNRGENDQTIMPEEHNHQTIMINDELYTVDRTRAHINKVETWKTWSVKKDGGWYQYKSSAWLNWTNANDIPKLNSWREVSLVRAGFPTRNGRRRGEEFTKERVLDQVNQVTLPEDGSDDEAIDLLSKPPGKRRPDFSTEEGDRVAKRVKAATGNRSDISPPEVVCEKINSQQKSTPKQAPRLKPPKAKSQTPLGEGLALERAGSEGRRTLSPASELVPASTTRTALLSQFQARTGEMQKSREVSQESTTSKNGKQR